jgi:prophage DNA circulation protein
MAWQDRLREAAYNSPLGTRTVLHYENVSRTIEKRTVGFEFPDADGTYVQDSGNSGRRFPLRVFFWGDDYDVQADAFEATLLERGQGKLEHPRYGSIDVVPFGTITQRDDLKTAANQAVIEVTFWQTIGVIYPLSQTDPASEVLASLEEYNEIAAETFEDVTSLTSAVEKAGFKNVYESILGQVDSVLQDVAEVQDDTRLEFNAILDSIIAGIDILVTQPQILAAQTTQLVQSPARAIMDVKVRLGAYQQLMGLITAGDDAVLVRGNDSSNLNTFYTRDLYASTYVTASVLSVVNNQFITKIEAIEAAESILELFSIVVNWRDDNFQSLEEVDTGGQYQQLQEAVALTAGFLVEISFNLKQERRVVLGRDRTIIDLTAELYGQVDSQLDFFISSNDLSGSEILELPKGREIVYYI